MTIAVIILSWLLANLWIAVLFTICLTKAIEKHDILWLLLMMVFSPLPVYIIVTLLKKS